MTPTTRFGRYGLKGNFMGFPAARIFGCRFPHRPLDSFCRIGHGFSTGRFAPAKVQHRAAKSAATVEPPRIVGVTMDPLTARMRCLDLADSLCDEDAGAADIIAVATTRWAWVMEPFTLEDVSSEENDDTATRQ
jgi:hypothetical protein